MPGDAGQGIIIRRYQAGDETAILELFEDSFHHKRSIEHWRWKFQENPSGAEHISVAWNGSEDLVAHYSAYPVTLQEGDARHIVHQIGDTMTAPSIRHIGRGQTSILGRTARHFFATFCDGQVALNYGFNVGNIQRFSELFLRSHRVDAVGFRVRNLAEHALKPLSRWERLSSGYRLDDVKEIGPEWNEFFERVASRYECLIRRDAAYVRWRYLTRPDVRYGVVALRKWGKLVGWLVFLVTENRMTIGDALFDLTDPEAFEVALRLLGPRHAIDRIEGWFSNRPEWFAGSLTRAGLRQESEPQDLSLMCTPFVRADAVERMRNAFYYTKGDSDLF